MRKIFYLIRLAKKWINLNADDTVKFKIIKIKFNDIIHDNNKYIYFTYNILSIKII